MTARHTLRAHAKLTLSLHVTGVRADGYHLIDAEMVSLELHDLLTFVDAPIGSTSLEATGPFADGMPLDGSNLVARALDVAGRGAQVTIDKRIPHGGGLGGGSTDARDRAALDRVRHVDRRARAGRRARRGHPVLPGGRTGTRVGDRRAARSAADAGADRREIDHPDHPAAAGEHTGGVPGVGSARPDDEDGPSERPRSRPRSW